MTKKKSGIKSLFLQFKLAWLLPCFSLFLRKIPARKSIYGSLKISFKEIRNSRNPELDYLGKILNQNIAWKLYGVAEKRREKTEEHTFWLGSFLGSAERELRGKERFECCEMMPSEASLPEHQSTVWNFSGI